MANTQAIQKEAETMVPSRAPGCQTGATSMRLPILLAPSCDLFSGGLALLGLTAGVWN